MWLFSSKLQVLLVAIIALLSICGQAMPANQRASVAPVRDCTVASTEFNAARVLLKRNDSGCDEISTPPRSTNKLAKRYINLLPKYFHGAPAVNGMVKTGLIYPIARAARLLQKLRAAGIKQAARLKEAGIRLATRVKEASKRQAARVNDFVRNVRKPSKPASNLAVVNPIS